MDTAVLLFERRWSSATRNVQHARAAIRTTLAEHFLEDTGLIELAIGEACANAVEHGSPHGNANSFILRCLLMKTKSTMIFEVEDEGTEFALTHLPLGQVPDALAEGGRGLFLIKQIMDEVTLQSTPHGLNIRMTKRLKR